jgi:hypothetical protein
MTAEYAGKLDCGRDRLRATMAVTKRGQAGTQKKEDDFSWVRVRFFLGI